MTGRLPSPQPSPASAQSHGGSRVGFRLDLARCVGCGACVLACRMENRLPPSVSWRRILQVNRPRIGGDPTYHLSVACHHCLRPPCVEACPSGALGKRPDGLVLLDAGRCVGCRYCEMACPFGAPAFDAQAGVMGKCHLCHERLAEDLAPACAAGCPTGALGFVSREGGGAREDDGDMEHKVVEAARELPGFRDPAGAGPSFWVVFPGGARRTRWFRELKALMGLASDESDASA